MKIHEDLQNCSPAIRRRIHLGWRREWGRIRRLLHRRHAEPVEVHLRGCSNHEGCQLRVILQMPRYFLLVEGRDALGNVDRAFSQLVANLEQEIRHYHDVLTGAASDPAHPGAGKEDLLERLDMSHERGDRLEFTALLGRSMAGLKSKLSFLVDFAQMSGVAPSSELAVEDLVDEIVARAWKDLGRRPEGMPLDRWLLGIGLEYLDSLLSRPSLRVLSLEEPVEKEETRWLVREALLDGGEGTFEEAPILEQVIPDGTVPDPLDLVERQEQLRWTEKYLSAKDGSIRRVFHLHAFEGWRSREIGMLLGIDPSEVDRLLEKARTELRRVMSASESPGPAQRAG